MNKEKLLPNIAKSLLIVGGLVWGIFGLFGTNVVSVFFGTGDIAKYIYILVGIAALYVLWDLITE